MIILDTLKPPPVEPAQAPTNMRHTSIVFENDGHLSKSAVEKPVVVIIELTWKKDLIKDLNILIIKTL
jgi:hypothetical protein